MTKTLQERFDVLFTDGFIRVARLADNGDDKGFAKELARLYSDILDWTESELSNQRKEIVEKIKKKRGYPFHEGYRNEILNEVAKLIEKGDEV